MTTLARRSAGTLPPGLVRKALRFKADDIAADGTFTGYGSVFGVVDHGGDVVMKGAFAASIARHAEAGTRPKLLRDHVPNDIVGRWIELREDDHGLWCKGQIITEIELGRETHILMKAGELDGLSIGFECQAWEHAALADIEAKYGLPAPATAQGRARLITQADLWEVSVVTFPMCAPAKVEAVKQAEAPRPGLAAVRRLEEALAARARILSRIQ